MIWGRADMLKFTLILILAHAPLLWPQRRIFALIWLTVQPWGAGQLSWVITEINPAHSNSNCWMGNTGVKPCDCIQEADSLMMQRDLSWIRGIVTYYIFCNKIYFMYFCFSWISTYNRSYQLNYFDIKAVCKTRFLVYFINWVYGFVF